VGFVDNGKNGKLAFAMAAAAAMAGEDSLYAKGRDLCAMQSFYTTTFMLHGHTGGGIGEIWRSAAMGLLYDKKPAQYRDFMDKRKWHYDLSRRYDGSFGIIGGGGYDKEQWGIAYPLTYTMPRKTLRITGAPPTKFSKRYELPKQPWGTEADNASFPSKRSRAKTAKSRTSPAKPLPVIPVCHSYAASMARRQPSDDDIRRYIHHPDYCIRFVAAMKTVGVNSGYIGWRKPGGKVRSELVMEFLQHDDPRVRQIMFKAIAQTGGVSDEIFELAVKAIKNDRESWSIKDVACKSSERERPNKSSPSSTLFSPTLSTKKPGFAIPPLPHSLRWPATRTCFDRILPAIGELVRTNQRISVTRGFAPAIRAQIKNAGPEVQELLLR
jgi:hypothetical protein